MTPRILYVEDNRDNLILVQRILRSEGCEVVGAFSAVEGIRMAEKHRPDLILMDINMPEMDGLTATNHLRQIPDLDDVPIVALTANVMRDVLEETNAAGCDGFITKPIDIDRFPEQVFSFLRNGRS
ncbi:MAG: response regulator [Anaerolineae bacterium]|nr:response regulator [Anaerolineae bacterium]